MSFLSKEQIIAARDVRFTEVDVPEWGGTVRIKSLDANESLHQESLHRKRMNGDDKANPIVSLLASSIVDAEGNRLFTEKDMAELGKKSPPVILRLVAAATKLNKMESVEGNSEASQDDASPSDSVSP